MRTININLFFLATFILINGCTNYEKEYYSNGEIKMKCEIEDDKLNGICEEFYETGAIKSKLQWKDGKLNGAALYYHPNGQFRMKGNYNNDTLEGMVYVYSQNGDLIDEYKYSKGKLNGESKIYYPSGKIQWIKIFENGELESYKKFDKEGNVVDQNRDLTIIAKKDVIKLGEMYEAEIKILNPLNDKMQVVLTEVDSISKVVDTLDIFNSDNFNIVVKVKPKKVGINTIAGIVKDVSIKNSENTSETEFTNEYLVVE